MFLLSSAAAEWSFEGEKSCTSVRIRLSVECSTQKVGKIEERLEMVSKKNKKLHPSQIRVDSGNAAKKHEGYVVEDPEHAIVTMRFQQAVEEMEADIKGDMAGARNKDHLDQIKGDLETGKLEFDSEESRTKVAKKLLKKLF